MMYKLFTFNPDTPNEGYTLQLVDEAEGTCLSYAAANEYTCYRVEFVRNGMTSIIYESLP